MKRKLIAWLFLLLLSGLLALVVLVLAESTSTEDPPGEVPTVDTRASEALDGGAKPRAGNLAGPEWPKRVPVGGARTWITVEVLGEMSRLPLRTVRVGVTRGYRYDPSTVQWRELNSLGKTRIELGHPGVYHVRTSSGVSRKIVAKEGKNFVRIMHPENVIVCHVVDGRNSPVGGAKIWVSKKIGVADSGVFVAQTGASGEATVVGVARGHFLSAWVDGYVMPRPISYEGPEGRHIYKLRVKQSAVRVSGVLLDENARGVGGCAVTIGLTMGGVRTSSGVPFVPSTAHSKGDGSFIVEGLPGGISLPLWVTSKKFCTHTEVLELPKIGDKKVTIILGRGGRLYGNIAKEFGAYGNVTIYVREEFDGGVSRAWPCPESGDKSLEFVKPGPYSIANLHRGLVEVSIYADGKQIEGPLMLDFSKALTVRHDIGSADLETRTVRVVTNLTTPLPQWRVELSDRRTGNLWGVGRTDEGGEIEFRLVVSEPRCWCKVYQGGSTVRVPAFADEITLMAGKTAIVEVPAQCVGMGHVIGTLGLWGHRKLALRGRGGALVVVKTRVVGEQVLFASPVVPWGEYDIILQGRDVVPVVLLAAVQVREETVDVGHVGVKGVGRLRIRARGLRGYGAAVEVGVLRKGSFEWVVMSLGDDGPKEVWAVPGVYECFLVGKDAAPVVREGIVVEGETCAIELNVRRERTRVIVYTFPKDYVGVECRLLVCDINRRVIGVAYRGRIPSTGTWKGKGALRVGRFIARLWLSDGRTKEKEFEVGQDGTVYVRL